MSSKRRKSKPSSNKSSNARKKVKQEAKAIVRKAKTPPRQRPPRTSLGFSGLGIEAKFQHDWSTAIPAAIGNVTETPRTRHSMSVAETELIGTIPGNATTIPVVNSYYINPGQIPTFPWLSGIAGKFELYRFKKLQFRWQPSSGTTDTGVVSMGIEYDPADAVLTTEAQLTAIPGAKTGSIYTGFSIDALAGGRSKFAKDLFISDNATLDQVYNLGRMILMVTGTTSTNATVVGRLYVDYVVDLYITQVSASGSLAGPAMRFQSTTNNPNTNLLSNAVIQTGSSGFGTIINSGANCKIMLYNAGTYYMIFYMNGAGFAGLGNIHATPDVVNTTTGVIGQSALQSTTTYLQVSSLTTLTPNVTFKLDITGTIVATSFVFITLIPYNTSLPLLPAPIEPSFEEKVNLEVRRQLAKIESKALTRSASEKKIKEEYHEY